MDGSSAPRPSRFTPGKDPVPTAQETGWASGPVWTARKMSGIWSPDRPASRTQSCTEFKMSAAALILPVTQESVAGDVPPSPPYITPTDLFVWNHLKAVVRWQEPREASFVVWSSCDCNTTHAWNSWRHRVQLRCQSSVERRMTLLCFVNIQCFNYHYIRLTVARTKRTNKRFNSKWRRWWWLWWRREWLLKCALSYLLRGNRTTFLPLKSKNLESKVLTVATSFAYSAASRSQWTSDSALKLQIFLTTSHC